MENPKFIKILMYLYVDFIDGVHPKTPHFSTRDLIRVKYQAVSKLFQLIFLLFLYLNIAKHISVI